MKKKVIISLVIISIVILMLFAESQNIQFENKGETVRGYLINIEAITAMYCKQITPLDR